ncbi:DUF3710 domain-containing protein [Streptacidiphilus sp. N1-12]|uniref:DUF3710 domain-containing protein n=2 Tax=Streptacidiphilus alkalitolerans TaxID=3342712 RepID=A0ABV6V908_9ACTN
MDSSALGEIWFADVIPDPLPTPSGAWTLIPSETVKEVLRLPLLEKGEQVRVVKWLKAVGDFVWEKEPLLKVTLDNVNITDIRSPWTGVLHATLAGTDRPAEVNDPLAVITPVPDLAQSGLHGPWDASQVTCSVFDELQHPFWSHLDYGYLLIPSLPGFTVHLREDKPGTGVKIVGVDGSTMSLQAFGAPPEMASWGEFLNGVAERAIANGGIVQDEAGPLGKGLRMEMPSRAGQTIEHIRIVGHEGPNWQLRGQIAGKAALGTLGSDAMRPMTHLFRNTIIVPSPAPRLPFSLPQTPAKMICATKPEPLETNRISKPFWFAVPAVRTLRSASGGACGELTPGTWYLALEETASGILTQTQEGVSGMLADTSGIQRG